jgi:hypothetical protein
MLFFTTLSFAFQGQSMFMPLALYDPEQFDDSTPSAIFARITVSTSFNLVRPDGLSVGDELCVGDRFALKKSADDGEFWNDGGHYDSPPIIWVEDAAKAAKEAIKCPGASFGYSGRLKSIPLYPISEIGGDSERGGAKGSVVCSLVEKIDSGGLDKDGVYYVASRPGTIKFNVSLGLRCMYYYVTGLGRISAGTPKAGAMVIPEGMEGMILPGICDKVTLDSLKTGDAGLSKEIRIVDGGAKPQIDLTVPDMDYKPGASANLRVLVKNTGNADARITKVSASVAYNLISCDSLDVKAGAQSECLITVTAQAGQGLSVYVDYESKACGRTMVGSASKSLMGASLVNPSASAQVYGIVVQGDCKNKYYSCAFPDKDGKFAAGYECYNMDGNYYTPANERFNLKYALPEMPGRTVLGGSLNLRASIVNKPQTLILYSAPQDWMPAACSAGGDICTQPYCGECAPIYDMPGDRLSANKINDAGSVSFDISEYVKSAYGNGQKILSFQIRGGEDLWVTQEKSTCGNLGAWVKQDVVFSSSGANQPYLEIVYK